MGLLSRQRQSIERLIPSNSVGRILVLRIDRLVQKDHATGSFLLKRSFSVREEYLRWNRSWKPDRMDNKVFRKVIPVMMWCFSGGR